MLLKVDVIVLACVLPYQIHISFVKHVFRAICWTQFEVRRQEMDMEGAWGVLAIQGEKIWDESYDTLKYEVLPLPECTNYWILDWNFELSALAVSFAHNISIQIESQSLVRSHSKGEWICAQMRIGYPIVRTVNQIEVNVRNAYNIREALNVRNNFNVQKACNVRDTSNIWKVINLWG